MHNSQPGMSIRI